jgi:hypothetical protein
MRAGSEHVEFIDQNVNFGVCNLRLKEVRYFSAILAGLIQGTCEHFEQRAATRAIECLRWRVRDLVQITTEQNRSQREFGDWLSFAKSEGSLCH